MADLVDFAVPANAQGVAEALGLEARRNVATGAGCDNYHAKTPRSRSSLEP
jgi:hypothetical protein